MKNKRNFTMVEPDLEGIDEQIRQHRRKKNSIIALSIILILAVAAGIILYFTYRRYSDYTVLEQNSNSDTKGMKYHKFNSGTIKYNNDGAIYMDPSGKTIWNQSYEMVEPIISATKKFVALGDKNGTKIYVLDGEKLHSTIHSPNLILDIEVADQGTVAVLGKGEQSYIVKIYDRTGKELVTGEYILKKKQYPIDFALSKDGKKMGVSLVDLEEGKLKTKVVFYNFGSVGQNEQDNIVSEVTYQDEVIPKVHFITNDRMIGYGTNSLYIYEGSQKPKEKKKIEVEGEIQNIYYDEKYFGYIAKKEDARVAYLYDKNGKNVLDKEIDINYEDVELLNNHELCFTSAKECLILNELGVRHFYTSFEEPLYKVISGENHRNYTFIFEGKEEKVKLK